MKTDRYTKFLLTVIAACLTVLTLQSIDIIPKAYAMPPAKPATLPIGSYGLVPVNPDGSITVKLNSEMIDVNLKNIEIDDELDVNIDEIGGGFVPYGGPIPISTR
jgi:hypothetical protein